jgi:DNA primase
MSYVDACSQLKLEPKKRLEFRTSELPKLRTVQDPPALWKEKSGIFVKWTHDQLMNHEEGLRLLRDRGFLDESLAKFCLGYNPRTYFRERPDWGLAQEVKENGQPKKMWLPSGMVIPTNLNNEVIKVKIRRSEWKDGDKLPKYVELSGSKQTPSVFGDTSLPGLVLESELDALLIQQEAGDLVYCVALGGSTKPLDLETDHLLRKSSKILFLPDFDEAGAVAWSKWKDKFSNIQRILTPHEKSAGDYFQAGGNLREWIEDVLTE